MNGMFNCPGVVRFGDATALVLERSQSNSPVDWDASGPADDVPQGRQSIGDTPNDATKAIPVLPYGPEQSRWFIKRLQENWRNSNEAS